jgi:WD40 repeat protein
MTPTPDVFYITGGTLRSDAPCYVARRADHDLYDGLTRGEFCYVLTARQMGKSSLMVRTAKRLRDGGAAVAVLDLTAVGQNLNAEQWYDGLLGRLGEQLNLEKELEAFWLGHARLGPLERCMRGLVEVALPACRGPLVVFIDEIDAVRSLPFSTDEFFAAVRECYNRRTADPALRRLTFCLLGVASPSDLIRDTRTTPFNIGLRVELDDFSEPEAAVLAQGLNRLSDRASRLLGRVLHWTRGHPYLTQRLCRSVAEDPDIDGPADVDRQCSRLFLSPRARERDDNLLFVRERILRSEVDRAALLDMYGRVRAGRRVPDEETDPLVGVLRLSGVARPVEGMLRVRNPIYSQVFDAEWVRTNMPDAEVRRQKRAFRRGLLRASAVAAVIMAVVGGLGWYAWRVTDSDLKTAADNKAKDAAIKAQNEHAQELQKARDDADGARKDAEKARDESRTLAVRYRVDKGMQLTAKGDLSGALVWFADPMDLEKSLPEREKLHRLRLEAALGQCPGLVRMWTHDGPVADAGFSADGARVVSAGADKTARVWDVASGDCVAVFKHDKPVTHAALSPDGRRALTVCKDDNTARLWDVRSPDAPRFTWEHARPVTCAVFDRAGDLAATAGEDGMARVWDVESGKAVTPPLRHVASRPAGDMAGAPPDMPTGRPGGEGPPLRSVAFDYEGKRVVTAGDDRTALVWDVSEDVKAPRSRITSGRPLTQAAFSPDGKWVVTAGGPVSYDTVPVGVPPAAMPAPSGFNLGGPLGPPAPAPAPGLGQLGGFSFIGNPPPGVSPTVPLPSSAPSLGPAPAPSDQSGLAPPVPDLWASREGAIQVWYAENGKLEAAAKMESYEMIHGDRITRVAFDPFSRGVATASEDRTAQVWRKPLPQPAAPDAAPPDGTTVKGTLLKAEKDKITIKDDAGKEGVLAVGPDAKVTINGLDGKVEDIECNSVVTVTKKGDVVTMITAAPPPVEDWTNSSTSYLALTPIKHTGAVIDIAFSPDGRYVVTASADGTARVWNARTYEQATPPLYCGGRVVAASFDPEGRRVLTAGEDGLVRLWDLRPYHQVTRPYLGVWSPQQASLSTTGKRSAVVDAEGVVWLADPSASSAAMALSVPSGATAAWLSPDGQRLATVNGRNGLQFWDAVKGKPTTATAPTQPVSFAVFSPDGRRLLTTDQAGGAVLWDADAGQRAADLETAPAGSQRPYVQAAAFSADGRMLALNVGGGKVDLFETNKAAQGPARTLAEPNAEAPASDSGVGLFGSATGAMVFSPDGRRLVVCTRTGARVWDVESGQSCFLLAHRDDATAAAFSPDGKRLVTCSRDTTARVWDAATGKEICDPLQHDEEVSCAVFSTDGRRVATGSRDGALRVWEAEVGLPLTPPLKQTGSGGVIAVAFLGDDRAATITDRQQVLAWDLAPQRRAPRDDLMASVQLLSGQQLFAGQDRLTALDAAGFKGLWQKRLTVRGAVDALPPDPVWRLRQAAAAEDENDMEVALWHLEQLRKSAPTPRLWARTANDLIQLGRLDDAERALEQAEALPKPADPSAAVVSLRWMRAQLQLARADSGARPVNWNNDPAWEEKRDKSLTAYAKVRELLSDLPADHVVTVRLTNDLSASYRDMGARLQEAFRLDAAEACFRDGWDLLRALPLDRPNLTQLKQDLTASILNLGNSRLPAADALHDDAYHKALAAARDTFLLGRAVNESIVGEDANRPEVLQQQLSLIRAAADVCRDLKATDEKAGEEALRHYRRALEVADRLTKLPVQHDDAGTSATIIIDAMYRIYLNNGDDENAEKYCRMNVDRNEAWIKAEPADAAARRMGAYTNSYVGEYLTGKGDNKGAKPYLERSHDLWERVVADGGGDDDKSNLATACALLAEASLRQHDYKTFRTHSDRNEQLLEGLVKVNDANDKYRQRLAGTYESRARVGEEEGAVAEARDYWRKALTQREQLLAKNATDDARRLVADDSQQLAGVELKGGDFRDALDHAQHSVDMEKARSDAAFGPGDVRSELAGAYLQLGDVALKSGRLDRAGEAYLGGLAVQQQAPRGSPGGVVWQSDLAALNAGLARLQLARGEAAEAVRLARMVVAGRQEPPDPRKALDNLFINFDDPTFFEKQQWQALGELADAYLLLGGAQLEAGDVDGARTMLGVALRMHQSLEKEDPREPRQRLSQAYDCEALGLAAMRGEDYATAGGLFRRALAILLRLDADGELKEPEDRAMPARLRRNLLFCDNSKDALGDLAPLLKRPRDEAAALLTLRAEALAWRNPTQDASETAEALRNLAPDDGANLFAVARCYAFLAHAVARGRPRDDLSDDERGRWNDYLQKGVEALGQAVDHGFKDGRALRSDPEIDSLRSDAGYEDIIDAMDRASK